MHSMSILRMIKRSLGLYSTPLWNELPFSTSWCSKSGNVAAGKGYNHVPASLEYPRGGRSEMDRDPEGQPRGYDTLPACKQSLAMLQVWCHCLAVRDFYFKHNLLSKLSRDT